MPRGARVILLLVVSLVTAVAVSPSGANERGVRTLTARDDLEGQILRELNALRRRHGLATLRVNHRLRAAADAHSAAMMTRGFFAHESADGSAFWKRVQRYYRQGPRSYWSVGENLLWSSPDVDAAAAVRMWVESPPHRKNMLNARWREVGLSAVHVESAPGVFGDIEVTAVTVDFGVRR